MLTCALQRWIGGCNVGPHDQTAGEELSAEDKGAGETEQCKAIDRVSKLSAMLDVHSVSSSRSLLLGWFQCNDIGQLLDIDCLPRIQIHYPDDSEIEWSTCNSSELQICLEDCT